MPFCPVNFSKKFSLWPHIFCYLSTDIFENNAYFLKGQQILLILPTCILQFWPHFCQSNIRWRKKKIRCLVLVLMFHCNKNGVWINYVLLSHCLIIEHWNLNKVASQSEWSMVFPEYFYIFQKWGTNSKSEPSIFSQRTVVK